MSVAPIRLRSCPRVGLGGHAFGMESELLYPHKIPFERIFLLLLDAQIGSLSPLGCCCEGKLQRVNVNIPHHPWMWRLQLVAAVYSVCVSISDMILDSCLF